MPPCRSPTVFILPRSTPMLTRVWAISADNPVTMTVAPKSREASTVWTRWFATLAHGRDARDVDHDDLGAIDPDAAEQLLGELTRALRVDDADDRKDQQSLAHGQDRRRELADRFLLLADDPLAFLDKAHGHRIGDAVGGRLIRVLDAIELREVCPIPGEQRAREHVAQQQHDPDDLVRFHPPAE